MSALQLCSWGLKEGEELDRQHNHCTGKFRALSVRMVDDILISPHRETEKNHDSHHVYTAWNLWKECKRRIFENTSSQPVQVLGFIKDEVRLRKMEFDSFLYVNP